MGGYPFAPGAIIRHHKALPSKVIDTTLGTTDGNGVRTITDPAQINELMKLIKKE